MKNHIFAVFGVVALVGCGPPVEKSQELENTQEAVTPAWLTLPTPAALPKPALTGTVQSDGADLYYMTFGDGPALVFLHGGLGNSENWGDQVPAFMDRYQVVLIDSRGHGRSTRDETPYSIDLLTDDVIAVLDALGIGEAHIVGWSDGGNTGLDMAMRQPDRVSSVFAFGANASPAGVAPGFTEHPLAIAWGEQATAAYQRLSPTPDEFDTFIGQISQMWAEQPNWTAADFARIHTRIAVVGAEHEEVILPEHFEEFAHQVPDAQIIMLEGVSHFAPAQDAEQFNEALRRFLEEH